MTPAKRIAYALALSALSALGGYKIGQEQTRAAAVEALEQAGVKTYSADQIDWGDR